VSYADHSAIGAASFDTIPLAWNPEDSMPYY